jgi:hypothetical protein
VPRCGGCFAAGGRASCRALVDLRAELRADLRADLCADLRADLRAGVQTCRCADMQTCRRSYGRSIAETFVETIIWAID